MRRSDVGAAGLAALAVLVGAYAASRDDPLPNPPSPPGTQVDVRSVELACPPPAVAHRSSPALLTVGVARAGASGRPQGDTRVRVLPGSGADSMAVLSRPGEARTVRLRPVGAGALTVVGRGGLAAGLAASEHTVVESGPRRGMATSACLPAAAAWHFVGAGNLPGHRGRLVLVNPDPAPAVVDLRLFGTGGELGAAGADSVVVGPDATRVVDVRALVGEQREVAIAVRATQGRVVAAVHDRWRAPLQPAGMDWLAPTAEPGRELVVAAGLPGTGRSRLLVANPGRREALVDVQVLGEDGPFRPVGLERLRVRPGTVTARELPAVASRRMTSVRLRADRPVTAAVRTRLAGGADVVVTPAGPGLSSRAVLAVPPGVEAVVAVANPARLPALVRLAAYDRDGARLGGAVLELPGGTTRAWGLPRPRSGAPPAYVVATPGRRSHPVATALVSGRGPQEGFAAALPVRSFPPSVVRPPVRFVLTRP